MKIQSNTSHVSRVEGFVSKKFSKFVRMDKNERIDNYSYRILNEFKQRDGDDLKSKMYDPWNGKSPEH